MVNELVAQASGMLRAQGGRMTAQRRLILQTLDELGGHPTAEQIYAAVHGQDETINPSTVYRTLGWLAEAGLVHARHLAPQPHGRACEQFDPSRPAEHHHFVCTRCGRVLEFESSYIEQAKSEVARLQGAIVERASLTLYGLCVECRQHEE